MVYDGFRKNGGPTLYGEKHTPVTADVLEIGFIFAASILAFSLLIILPGYSGKNAIFHVVKVLVGVFVTVSIMLCNFGQEWEVARAKNVTTQYKAGVIDEIHADIEVKISLRSINITLKGVPDEKYSFGSHGAVETINYNERFRWDSLGWVQGRAGFGSTAGLFNREFREAQRKGSPYPILWIAEYFTIDGEGVRWGRYYRQAGWYTHIMVWLALPLWWLSMILFHMVLHYGAYFSIMTGLSLIIANIIYSQVRNPFVLKIPVGEYGDYDGQLAVLEFGWGWCFGLNLFTGILCFMIGVLFLIMNVLCVEKVSAFFGIDVLQQYEEYYVDVETLSSFPLISTSRDANKSMKKTRNVKPAVDTNEVELEDTYEAVENVPPKAPPPLMRKRYKQKGSIIGSKFQKTMKKTPRADTGYKRSTDEEAAYERTDGNQNGSFQNRAHRTLSGEVDNNFDADNAGRSYSILPIVAAEATEES